MKQMVDFLSYVGMGTGTHGGNGTSDQKRSSQFHDTVERAIKSGIRMFDTAVSYGTHSVLANSLRRLDRRGLFLQSKTLARTAYGVRADVESMLNGMQTEYIDSVLLHCVDGTDWPEFIMGAADELQSLRGRGLIRHIGVSIHGLSALEVACDHKRTGWVDICMVRINDRGVAMDGRPAEVVPCMKKIARNGKSIVGMKICGGGEFTKEQCRQSMRFVAGLRLCSVLVVGFTSPEQVDETVGALLSDGQERGAG